MIVSWARGAMCVGVSICRGAQDAEGRRTRGRTEHGEVESTGGFEAILQCISDSKMPAPTTTVNFGNIEFPG